MALPFPLVWAYAGDVRDPTTPEMQSGFPCGAADRVLFNGLFQDIQQAINALFLRNGDADIPVLGWQATPPASPVVGDRYLVASAPTGAWAGQANKIAMWAGGAWAYADPVVGLIVNFWNGSRQVLLFWTGTAWIDKAVAERAQGLNYRAAGGTANALTITLDPVPASYTELVGAPIRVKIASTNTGAATLNVNGLGAKPIVRLGSGAAVGAGDLAAGAIYVLIYDGTSFQVSGAGGVALQTGGSTAAAPKLLNVDASTTTTFSVPTSTDTLLQYQTTNNLNLGTTTWSGSRLTIGSGEAGLWSIQASWVFTASAPSNFSTARLRKNGSAIVSEAAPATQSSGSGAVLQTISTLKLAAGDYIEALGNHQAGSTQTALADQRARFVAMLLSSY